MKFWLPLASTVLCLASVVFVTYLGIRDGEIFHQVLAPVMAAVLTYTNTRAWQAHFELKRLEREYDPVRTLQEFLQD